MTRRCWFRTRRAATPPAAARSPEKAQAEPESRPLEPPCGPITTSEETASLLREATVTLIDEACRKVPSALTDERRLDRPFDSLDEVFQVILLRTMFGRLGRSDDSGSVVIDDTDHFRPLLQRAVEIARNTAADELRKAISVERRRVATHRSIELQLLARKLACAERSRARRDAGDDG